MRNAQMDLRDGRRHAAHPGSPESRPSHSCSLARALAFALALVLAHASQALAGSMVVAWEPAPESDVQSYRVYYGTTPGALTQFVDAGLANSVTLTGLTDCTLWYADVRAVDDAGLESPVAEQIISGWPRPEIGGVTPPTLEAGQTLEVTVSGANFDPGAGTEQHPAATASIDGPGLTIVQSAVDHCGQLRLTIQASPDALPGAVALTVLNVDLSRENPTVHPRVFGTLTGALTVTGNAAPVVTATFPAPGATNVAADVQPSVTLSEAIDPNTVSSATVRLIDPSGAAVPMLPGAPSVSGNTITLRPSASLEPGATYRLVAGGGASGLRDLSGTPLASDFTQAPGFTITTDENDVPPTVSIISPAAGATNVPSTTLIRVTFSEPVDPSSVSPSNVLLLNPEGSIVALASAPLVNGAEVTLTPASPLAELSTYRVQVIGGDPGIKDLTGRSLATSFTQTPGFTTKANDDSPPANAVVTSTSPANGAGAVDLAARTIRIVFDRDMSALASALPKKDQLAAFRILSAGKVQALSPDSPRFLGTTVELTMKNALAAGVSYQTAVDLSSAKIKNLLAKKGLAELAMTQRFTAGWSTANAIERAAYIDPGTGAEVDLLVSGQLIAAAAGGVPVDAEFRLTFAAPVSPSTANLSTIRITKGTKKVTLRERPTLVDANRTIVLQASGLAPGSSYQLRVGTGRTGVILVTPSGNVMIGTRTIAINFSTEVSSTTQSSTLAIDEPLESDPVGNNP